MVELRPIDPTPFDVFSNPCNLRRDLHVFVDYVQSREVKRLHRTNGLGKSDANRLAKLMSDSEAVAEVREHGESVWIDFVDRVAWSLKFVSYDVKGVYAGYTSNEPSFPDNYITFNPKPYQDFVTASLNDQEAELLYLLKGEADGCRSEFFNTGTLGRLDPFSNFGCGVGVVPTLDFPHVRHFLLDLLQTCQVGVWYSTASLVEHLKLNNPYFLIPKNPRVKGYSRYEGRYGNFREGISRWEARDPVPDDAPDAFERVEGRYVERFLEGLPLLLGYVDVAYRPQSSPQIYPTRDQLVAFRVTSRLAHALQQTIPEPKVMVQPNFEVFIESAFYPGQVLNQLLPLGEVTADDLLTIIKLDRVKVAAQVAQDDTLDVIALLTRLSQRNLPANVIREVREWTAQADKFILYEGFGLLEGGGEADLLKPYLVEQISAQQQIVHSPGVLFRQLEAAEAIPLAVIHGEAKLTPLPDKAKTVFVKRKAVRKPKRKAKETITLKQQTIVVLYLPSSKVLEVFRLALLKAHCPVEIDTQRLTISYQQGAAAQVQAVLKTLQQKFVIQIEGV